jgi:hypothetical protein
MSDVLREAVLIAATLTVGPMAGVFGIYSNAIMPGLGRADDRTFVAAFQSIDRAIINPAFMATFLGALVFTALAALLHLGDDDTPVLPWIEAALALYLLVFEPGGSVGTTCEHSPVSSRSAYSPGRWSSRVRRSDGLVDFVCLAFRFGQAVASQASMSATIASLALSAANAAQAARRWSEARSARLRPASRTT